ncbi:hypothetical protein KKC16_01235 [Patescibacteria group bacterium]|nr:hypothetical protein [Patescibacteria group bacterium]MBU4482058.1 hypothetical protein [Patescibacteria group bacterium]
MSKFFCLCSTNAKKHNLKNVDAVMVKSRRNKASSFYCLSLVLLFLILAAGSFYIFQITSNVTTGIQTHNQTEKINELKLANELLNERLHNLENLNNIKSRAAELGLVAVAQAEYLNNDDNEMALSIPKLSQ